jgi:hypothetical protein
LIFSFDLGHFIDNSSEGICGRRLLALREIRRADVSASASGVGSAMFMATPTIPIAYA